MVGCYFCRHRSRSRRDFTQVPTSKSGSFWDNILANLAVSAFIFAAVAWLIEGQILTREQRLRKVIAIAARTVATLNEEIALTEKCLPQKNVPLTEGEYQDHVNDGNSFLGKDL